MPLGSPKFDKVRTMKCEVEGLPKEWQRIIMKPDGNRKKIILYNNSMMPWLRDAFMQRINEFQEESWGIYDKTPAPNLAMVLSDGYYGDESNLVTTYKETGKPILMQNVYILD